MSKALQASREEAVSSALHKSKSYRLRGKLVAAFTELDRVSSEVGHLELTNHTMLCKSLVSLCNKLGKGSPQYLRRADELLQRWGEHASIEYLRLTVQTLSSWAAYHRQHSNLHSAMKYLIRALKVPFDTQQPDLLDILARTQLSLGTLSYELTRYKASAEFCRQALQSLQKVKSLRASTEVLSSKQRTKQTKTHRTLVWTYLNLGLAERKLQNIPNAVKAFSQAVSCSDEFLKPTDPLKRTCKEALESTKETPHRAKLQPISSAIYKRPLSALKTQLSFSQRDLHTSNTDLQEDRTDLNAQKTSLAVQTVHQTSTSTDPSPGVPGRHSLSVTRTGVGSPETTLPIGRVIDEGETLNYYTPRRLNLLHEKMDSKPEFISADLYFSRKIMKVLQADPDLNHLRQTGLHLAEKSVEQQRLHDLKKKRNSIKTQTEQRGADYIRQRLKVLESQASAETKKAIVLTTRQAIYAKSSKSRSSLGSTLTSDKKLTHAHSKSCEEIGATAKEEIDAMMEEISSSLKRSPKKRPDHEWLLKTKHCDRRFNHQDPSKVS
jgi:hypothetical protein